MAKFSEVYEEILEQFNAMDVPQCIYCESQDTASVECGIIGLTMALSAKCRKFKLIGNGPKLAEWYCNECKQFFNDDGTPPLPEDCEQEPQNAKECIEAIKKHGGFTISLDKFLKE
ncbi:hypothetical protein N9A79_00135 [Pirellulales bacterium]|nr:hypothetical protein [Pirellulales bacterium]